eukprot:8758224-Pyramimonas_sp.AAC.2
MVNIFPENLTEEAYRSYIIDALLTCIKGDDGEGSGHAIAGGQICEAAAYHHAQVISAKRFYGSSVLLIFSSSCHIYRTDLRDLETSTVVRVFLARPPLTDALYHGGARRYIHELLSVDDQSNTSNKKTIGCRKVGQVAIIMGQSVCTQWPHVSTVYRVHTWLPK